MNGMKRIATFTVIVIITQVKYYVNIKANKSSNLNHKNAGAKPPRSTPAFSYPSVNQFSPAALSIYLAPAAI